MKLHMGVRPYEVKSRDVFSTAEKTPGRTKGLHETLYSKETGLSDRTDHTFISLQLKFLKAVLTLMCVEKQIFTNTDTSDRQNGSQLFVTL